MSTGRICIVSPGHLASNPRLVKEADALHEAGYAVRVVAGDTTPSVRPLDRTILARAPWSVVSVGVAGRAHYLAKRLRQEVARSASKLRVGGISELILTQSPLTQSLAKAAVAERADLYIGHYLAGLAAAALAARHHNAKLGFDAEDDHVGELIADRPNRIEISIRKRIESHFLPQCDYLTAASPGIAAAYRNRYGVIMTPILNVFPLAHAPDAARANRTNNSNGAISVYWFSQTIGPGRGLENFIEAMGKIRGLVTLSIRGNDLLSYSEHLKTHAARNGVANYVRFLPSAPPDEMVRLAALHDVGLALELDTPPSRAIGLTNKIFVYLLAGIPTLLSNTPAQQELAAKLGPAAQVTSLLDSGAVAAVCRNWATDRAALAVAKAEAWRLGQTRFNWDLEKSRLLRTVRETLH
jgi:glycosyltransferase involved in cell wall biosynthesis